MSRLPPHWWSTRQVRRARRREARSYRAVIAALPHAVREDRDGWWCQCGAGPFDYLTEACDHVREVGS
jgi:hypothetical protein